MFIKHLLTLWRFSFWTLVLVASWLALVPAEQIPSVVHFWDKAQHSAGFAALAFVGMLSFPGRLRRLMLGLMLFGAGIECIQYLTGWRQGDWADWVADCVGLGVGSMVWKMVMIAWFNRVRA